MAHRRKMTLKYKSTNKTVSKGLNSSWTIIGIPFFSLMIGTFVLGFFLLDKYEISGELTPGLIILIGIILPTIVCHFISKVWFSFQIDKVTDKREFVERAKRNMMIWPPTADKILSKKGIVLTDRQGQFETVLQDLQLSKRLTLTNEQIIINGQEFQFQKIKDFRISATKSGGLWESVLMLIFKDNKFERHNLGLVDKQEIEFQIDKYLNNHKLKATMPQQGL
ncbi:MAG: hypothetical protein RLO12_13505 [Fulvivirga sp.]